MQFYHLFLLLLILDVHFLIPAVIAHIFNLTVMSIEIKGTEKSETETEKLLVTTEAKIRKYKPFLSSPFYN